LAGRRREKDPNDAERMRSSEPMAAIGCFHANRRGEAESATEKSITEALWIESLRAT
jgi:hypothetical protein